MSQLAVMASDADMSESEDEINQNKNKSYSSMQADTIGKRSDSKRAINHGEIIVNENGDTIKNAPKCTEEFATLPVLPINLSTDVFEINIAPDISQIYQSNVKTIAPNFLCLERKMVCMRRRPKSCDPKPDPLIQSVIEEPDEHIAAGAEELHLEICLKNLEENNACIPVRNTDPVVVVPEICQKKSKEVLMRKDPQELKKTKIIISLPNSNRR
ncbi:hypothetical protein TNCT_178011 [Trichonephila clavata]|uniref:Uncharacterized protein n=1 Tax=Trichonephila clavata TaxID=2740835 RepID=A0A8X6G656_TRICU|nr:hypothetical protein TNCT_178011 [Trichonephila clavata]